MIPLGPHILAIIMMGSSPAYQVNHWYGGVQQRYAVHQVNHWHSYCGPFRHQACAVCRCAPPAKRKGFVTAGRRFDVDFTKPCRSSGIGFGCQTERRR